MQNITLNPNNINFSVLTIDSSCFWNCCSLKLTETLSWTSLNCFPLFPLKMIFHSYSTYLPLHSPEKDAYTETAEIRKAAPGFSDKGQLFPHCLYKLNTFP